MKRLKVFWQRWIYWRQYQFFYGFIVTKLFRHPENAKLTFILMVLRFIILPLNTIFHLWVNYSDMYDAYTDTYTIHGHKYTGRLFGAWGNMPLGSLFRLVKREDGVIAIEDLRHWELIKAPYIKDVIDSDQKEVSIMKSSAESKIEAARVLPGTSVMETGDPQ